MKLTEYASKIGMDKVIHCCLSGWLTMIAFAFCHDIIISMLVVMTIGIIKEFSDMSSSGFGIRDIVADTIGIFSSAVILIIQRGIYG